MNNLCYMFCILIFIAFCCLSAQNEVAETQEVKHTSWSKAVIANSSMYSLLPSKIPNFVKIKENEYFYPKLESPVLLSIGNISFVSGNLLYNKKKFTLCNTSFTKDFHDSLKLYGKNNSVYPVAWDILDYCQFSVDSFVSDVVTDKRYLIHSINRTWKSLRDFHKTDKPKKGIVKIGIPNNVSICNPLYNSIELDMKTKVGLSVESKETENIRIVYYQFSTDLNDYVIIHLLRENILYRYVFDGFNWKFSNAVKMPRTEPFEIISQNNNLFVLSKDFGIYKFNKNQAENTKLVNPDVNVASSDDYCTMVWEGFTEEQKEQEFISAEKISDFKYDSYVVDKDHNTGYVIVDGFLYEIGHFDRRIKLDELQNTDTFLDEQAERMRVVLIAINNLSKTSENTPAALLKVTPDSEIEKKLTDNNSNSDNTNGGSDDDETNKDPNKKNGNTVDEESNNSDDSSSNSNSSANKNSQNPNDNRDNTSANQNSNNSNPDPTNTSGGSNFAIYVGGALGLMILITLIFIFLPRKKN